MAGIENLACAFGFDRNIRALARAFGVGDCPCNKYENMLFGTDGIISCTPDYWMEVIHDLCNQIEELRAQIKQLSTKILRDLSEPEKALSEAERACNDAKQAEDRAREALRGQEERLKATQAALADAEQKNVKFQLRAARACVATGQTDE